MDKKSIALSEIEHDALILTTQGYTMIDLNAKLCRSIYTKHTKEHSLPKW